MSDELPGQLEIIIRDERAQGRSWPQPVNAMLQLASKAWCGVKRRAYRGISRRTHPPLHIGQRGVVWHDKMHIGE
eukprot:354152-Chlamydomonas_euryale.AAC.1